jgi:uncharacterized protein (DUF2147 family)
MKLIFTFLVLLIVSNAVAQSTNNVLGLWVSEKRDAKIEIYQQADKLFGKIVWTKTNGIKDTENPDISLREKPLLGLVILTNFESAGTNKWESGKIYDPSNGKTYSCNMKLNKDKLEIRGYVGISLFGRTSIWTRK